MNELLMFPERFKYRIFRDIHKIVRLIYLEEVNKELGQFKRHTAPFPEGHIPRSIVDVTLMKQLMAIAMKPPSG